MSARIVVPFASKWKQLEWKCRKLAKEVMRKKPKRLKRFLKRWKKYQAQIAQQKQRL